VSSRLIALVLGLTLAAGACSSPPFIDLPNPIAGMITNPVDAETFVLTTDSGRRLVFRNANPDDPGMGQVHLRQHVADRYPVVVTWRRDGYDLVATQIEDGPQPTQPASPPFQDGLPS
jgi:hypothetical protein